MAIYWALNRLPWPSPQLDFRGHFGTLPLPEGFIHCSPKPHQLSSLLFCLCLVHQDIFSRPLTKDYSSFRPISNFTSPGRVHIYTLAFKLLEKWFSKLLNLPSALTAVHFLFIYMNLSFPQSHFFLRARNTFFYFFICLKEPQLMPCSYYKHSRHSVINWLQ